MESVTGIRGIDKGKDMPPWAEVTADNYLAGDLSLPMVANTRPGEPFRAYDFAHPLPTYTNKFLMADICFFSLCNVLVWLFLGLYLYVFQDNNDVMLIMACITYFCGSCLCLCCNCWMAQDFRPSRWKTPDEVEKLLKTAIERKPKITEHIECYHREKRGSDTIKVVTFNKDMELGFNDFYDVSPLLNFTQNKHRVVKFNVKKEYRGENQRADEALLAQKTAFVDEHKNKDQYYHVTESIDLDLPEIIMVNAGKSGTRSPWWYNMYCVCLCNLISLGAIWLGVIKFCCSEEEYVYTNTKVLTYDKADERSRQDIEMKRNNNVIQI